MSDKSVSHLFVHMSDRFARPETGAQGMQLEQQLLYAGLTIVFENRIAKPRQRGKQYIAEDIQCLVEYSQNGEHLNKHSHRILDTQVRQAKRGHWSGSRAPYGFARVLVGADGQEIRDLQPGEKVKQQGCHVEIRPRDQEKIKVWLQILDLKANKRWGDKRIARHLNELNILSPSGGRPAPAGGTRLSR